MAAQARDQRTRLERKTPAVEFAAAEGHHGARNSNDSMTVEGVKERSDIKSGYTKVPESRIHGT